MGRENREVPTLCTCGPNSYVSLRFVVFFYVFANIIISNSDEDIFFFFQVLKDILIFALQ